MNWLTTLGKQTPSAAFVSTLTSLRSPLTWATLLSRRWRSGASATDESEDRVEGVRFLFVETKIQFNTEELETHGGEHTQVFFELLFELFRRLSFRFVDRLDHMRMVVGLLVLLLVVLLEFGLRVTGPSASFEVRTLELLDGLMSVRFDGWQYLAFEVIALLLIGQATKFFSDFFKLLFARLLSSRQADEQPPGLFVDFSRSGGLVLGRLAGGLGFRLFEEKFRLVLECLADSLQKLICNTHLRFLIVRRLQMKS